MEISEKKEKTLSNHSDMFEVMSGTYPKSSDRIRKSLLARVRMVFGEDSEEYLSAHHNRHIEPKGRIVSYDELHRFIGECFGRHEQEMLELEDGKMSELRSEAEEIDLTAKKICEITGKSFVQSINFLLDKDDKTAESSKGSIGTEILPTRALGEKTSLTEIDKTYIRTYVAEGKDEEDKKKRRVEMAHKFNISVRQAGIISSWSNRSIFHKKKNSDIGKKPEESDMKGSADVFAEYLEEFFEGNLQNPQDCGISYNDMHDCFHKDSGIELGITEITRIWQKMMIEKEGIGRHNQRSAERRLSISLVKSRHKLASGEFVIDKSCNVLLPYEVTELLEIK